MTRTSMVWLAALMVLGATRPLAAQGHPRSELCTTCHLQLSNDSLAKPARDFPGDIHAEKGLGCLDCHGVVTRTGSKSIDPGTGFLRRPARKDIPALCGRCHSDAAYMRTFNPSLRVDQVTEYWTSVHGQRLSRYGDPNVATCIDCHPPHRIRPPSDPASTVYAGNVAETCGRCHADRKRMAEYGIPTDQLEQYRQSVHGRKMTEDGDMSAPTCNDCHGNHGAVPPGVGSIRNVCGQCHSMMADLFAGNGHPDLFEKANLPGCETCHGNHGIQLPTDGLLSERETTVCQRCHAPGDTLGAAFATMRVLIDSLQASYALGKEMLGKAENAGMEVSQAQFELSDATTSLTKARTAIHSFQVEPVRTEVAAGLLVTTAAQERGRTAMEEHRYRRVGLATSASLILLLVFGLMLKIREIEEPRRGSGDARVDPESRSDHVSL